MAMINAKGKRGDVSERGRKKDRSIPLRCSAVVPKKEELDGERGVRDDCEYGEVGERSGQRE